nr:sodium:calcium antiporter [Actinomycetota bacterium]
MFTIIELLLSAAAIVVAAALFTNAIEILGERLNLGAGAVGSILAAVGTALPETMIPVVAIVVSLFTGASAAGDIGVGAILGAPFLLATLAMFVVGIAVWSYQRRRESGDTVTVDVGTAKRDTLYFLGLYSLGAAAGILPLPFYAKVVLAIALVAAYVLFIRQ